MSDDGPDPGAVRGLEMDEGQLDSFLVEQGHGVLSLADSGTAYGFPVSFGYDGERLYLSLLQFGETSEKLTMLTRTDQACVITYDVVDQFRWKSAIVRGPIDSITDDDIALMDEVMEDNAWFPNIHPPPDPVTGVSRLAMNIREASGRHGPGYQG